MMSMIYVRGKGEIMKRATINGVTKITARDGSGLNGGFEAAVQACPCTVLVLDVADGPLGNDGLQYPDVAIVTVGTHTAFDLGQGGWIAEETRFPVLIHLEAYDEVAEALALRLGAQDVIYSEQPARSITERIAAVHRRWTRDLRLAAQGTPAPQAEAADTEAPMVRVDAGNYSMFFGRRQVVFTGMEICLLRELATRLGTLVNRETLVDALRQAGFSGSVRGIDSHIKRIRGKIADAGCDASFLSSVYGGGYMMCRNDKDIVVVG
jgi:DNA-binding response OmpR family regulator